MSRNDGATRLTFRMAPSSGQTDSLQRSGAEDEGRLRRPLRIDGKVKAGENFLSHIKGLQMSRKAAAQRTKAYSDSQGVVPSFVPFMFCQRDFVIHSEHILPVVQT